MLRLHALSTKLLRRASRCVFSTKTDVENSGLIFNLISEGIWDDVEQAIDKATLKQLFYKFDSVHVVFIPSTFFSMCLWVFPTNIKRMMAEAFWMKLVSSNLQLEFGANCWIKDWIQMMFEVK